MTPTKRKIRHRRIRKKIKGTSEKPRLCVFRSNQHIYAQLINDSKGSIIESASDFEIKGKSKTKKEAAYEVGKLIAQKAQDKNIKKIVFDRAGYKYHGRVKKLAQGAREQGLEF